MSEQKPNYYAIIPADVRYSKISANAKLLYGEITALCNEKGYCWASNSYFGELYGMHLKTVSGWISELTANGFIKSIISPAKKGQGVSRKLLIGLHENAEGSPRKHGGGLHENTEYNNTSNNTVNKKTKAKNSEKILKELIEIVNPKEKATDDRIRKLNGLLKSYSESEITHSAVVFSTSQWHIENKQMSVDNLLAPSKFGRWYAQSQEQKNTRGFA